MRKLLNIFGGRRNRMERDLARELEYHFSRRTKELVESGLNAVEAQRQAALELGGLAQIQEEVRDEWLWPWVRDLGNDLRHALRLMLRNPGLTATAVLSLALGIGANTAIFTLIDAVLLKMLPVARPQELVLLQWVVPAGTDPIGAHRMDGRTWEQPGRSLGTSFSYALFRQIRARATGPNRPLTDALAFSLLGDVNVVANGEAGIASAQVVSWNYYDLLGVRTSLGRSFVESDDQQAATPVCVIGERYWKRAFAADPAIVGKVIGVNGTAVTVIGVSAPDFFSLQPGSAIDITLPLSAPGSIISERLRRAFAAPDHWWLQVMGRLNPPASGSQATVALDTIFKQTASQNLAPVPGEKVALASLELVPGGQGIDRLRREFSEPLLVLMAMVAIVLLIACVNVANLLLARATARHREVAIRLSIGASRGRLIRQFLGESLALAFTGGTLGFALAFWGSRVLVMLISDDSSPMPLDLSPDLQVLGFTAGICLLTGLAFGLAPAVRATRVNLAPALQRGAGRLVTPGLKAGLGKALVVAEAALCVVLLFGAGLFVRTLGNLQRVDTGFSKDSVLLFGVDASQAGYKGQALYDFYDRVQQRISGLPGVAGCTSSLHLLLSGSSRSDGLAVSGYTPRPNERMRVRVMPVGPDFFKTMKIRLLRGRDFTGRDTEMSPKVAVVNETVVKRYFEGRDPIGQRIGWAGENAEMEIVGVAKDARYDSLRGAAPATVYHPFRQARIGGMHFEVRAERDPKALIPDVRRALASIDRNIPMYDVKTQAQQMDELLVQERLFAKLAACFGLLALMLASVGLYGVLSYAVVRRTAEIGIRMALGANRGNVMGMLLAETLRLVGLGLAVGVPASLGTARIAGKLVSNVLYGLKANDATSLAIAAGVLVLVSVVTTVLPARRASRLDPMTAIRYE